MKKVQENLVITRKTKGRAYKYMGGDIPLPWRLKDMNTGTLYDSYEDYVTATKPVVKTKVTSKTKAKPATKTTTKT